jgi:hypothetical protein
MTAHPFTFNATRKAAPAKNIGTAHCQHCTANGKAPEQVGILKANSELDEFADVATLVLLRTLEF